jgi:hypothetical protein
MRCGSGSRCQALIAMTRAVVAAWAPFMDDVDAIIFLAPISCFDQVLAEDPNVNRLVCFPVSSRIPSRTHTPSPTGRFRPSMEISRLEPPAEKYEPRVVLEQVRYPEGEA